MRFHQYSHRIRTLRRRESDLLSTSVTGILEQEATKKPLLPNLRKLIWEATVWDHSAHLLTFCSPSMTSLQIECEVEPRQTSAFINDTFSALAARPDIDLQELELAAEILHIDRGVGEYLHSHRNITTLVMPDLWIGNRIDEALTGLPLHKLQLVGIEADDNTLRAWLASLLERIPTIDNLGLSFDLRTSHSPELPVRRLAPLLHSSTLLHVKIGFSPQIELEDDDIRAMSEAWPCLQSLWIYNWGDGIGSCAFPLTVLGKFAKHMPPTFRSLSIDVGAESNIEAPSHRFTSLRYLLVGSSILTPEHARRLVAYFASLCPLGTIICCEQDPMATPLSEDEEWTDFTAEVRRVQESAVSSQ